MKKVVIETFALNAPPKGSRNRLSRLEMMPQWVAIKAAVDAGIPKGKGHSIRIHKADRLEYGLKNQRSVPRAIERYIRESRKPYTVGYMDSGDYEYILVKNP